MVWRVCNKILEGCSWVLSFVHGLLKNDEIEILIVTVDSCSYLARVACNNSSSKGWSSDVHW